MNSRECIALQMNIITRGLQGAVDAIARALNNGDTAAALVTACREFKDLEQGVKDLYKDYGKTLPAAELAARKAAAKFLDKNLLPWDRDESQDTDPLALQVPTDDIANQIADMFGDDAPADLIKALKEC